MSTTSRTLVEHEPLGTVTPIRLEASSLESTSSEYLRDLQTDLVDAGYAPVELTAEARFDDDCPIAIQSDADRVRDLVTVASTLGTNRLVVEVRGGEASDAAETALAACVERARRECVHLEIEGPVAIEH